MAPRGLEGAEHGESIPDRTTLCPQFKPLNVETSNQRLCIFDMRSYTDKSRRKRDQFPPTIATWRCNLVASSQRRNLLFSAHGHQIYVWIPAGPFQLLGTIPEMIITPVMENPDAGGYIDQRAPHTINHMIVDDLGRDEIIVLATDSGNVCAYHVEAIFSAISRCTSHNYKKPFDDSEVSPFFVEGVDLSAWGLAVHKFARLIAVSSNTSHITVFAFALATDTSEDGSDDDLPQAGEESELDRSDKTWLHIDNQAQLAELNQKMPHNHRARNLRITYRGHFDNVPSVSFANFDLDANGTWMVSTDISNRVLVWQIWKDLFPRRVYYPGHPMNNPPERGWTVMPLDPRTFRRLSSPDEACGCRPGSMMIAERNIVDLSEAIEEIPDASHILTFGAAEYGDFEVDYLPNDVFSDDARVEPEVKTYEVESGSTSSESAADEAVDASSDLRIQSPDGPTEPESEKNSKLRPVILRKRSLPSIFEEDNEHARAPSFAHPEFDQEASLGYMHYRTLTNDLFRCCSATSPTLFPVLHLSEHHISLAPYPLDSEYQLISRNVLFQRFSYSVEISAHCDRFNMVKYVPELKLVIAASQKGRVAILSLTWHHEIGFAFRVDWILPFASQERRDERPMIPLLGIAVSPMPGFEVPHDVPFIPTGQSDVSFQYRTLDTEDNEQSNPSDSGYPKNPKEREPASPTSSPTSPPRSTSESSESKQTLAERHAQASSSHRPRESWHGLHPSRHYRLMLYYCDHTVLSYEFWHDWQK
ncbi:hypothetical protein N7470_007572 [Penicillium chermesinum]|nr:hypothetical protein N7470_007572 [Penicillium chermesinum]